MVLIFWSFHLIQQVEFKIWMLKTQQKFDLIMSERETISTKHVTIIFEHMILSKVNLDEVGLVTAKIKHFVYYDSERCYRFVFPI